MTPLQFATRAARKIILPIAPRSFRLPFQYYLALIEGGHEPELRHLDAICQNRNVAIDVGANLGLYSYKLSRLFQRVFAFEINPDLTLDLSDYNAPNIEVICSGLSSITGEATLYVPLQRGIRLNGCASLSRDNWPEGLEYVTKAVLIKSLDSFAISGVSFIKIDVEGHEIAVLEGAMRTLTECRPVLLLESNEPKLTQVRSFLSAIGYEEKSLRQLAGVEGAPQNHIFVPIQQVFR
jgi:FkbM family methyltransferase